MGGDYKHQISFNAFSNDRTITEWGIAVHVEGSSHCVISFVMSIFVWKSSGKRKENAGRIVDSPTEIFFVLKGPAAEATDAPQP